MASSPSSVLGEAIRISKLGPNGKILTDENSVYTFKEFISFSFTPEYEDGDEFTQKNAKGGVCVTYKAPDTFKRLNLSIAICNPDPIVEQLLGGGDLLAGDDPANPVGWAAPAVGEDPVPNGVAIEVWSHAVTDGKQDANTPYFHWVFPYAKLRQSGERVIQNDILATEFEGWSVGNEGFGSGPATPYWGFPNTAKKPYSYARVGSTLPTAGWTTAVPKGG